MHGAAGPELKRRIYAALFATPVRRVVARLPVLRRVYNGWARPHPFDRAYGTTTSGIIGVAELQPDAATGRLMEPYAGSQPSIVRRALSDLPDKQEYVFVDLGCGKGRAVLVASEFAFQSVIGVDISPTVLSIARSNVSIIRRQFPARPPIYLVRANACQFVPMGERLVFFLYHPFGREGVVEFLALLNQRLSAHAIHVFLIYYNPVWGALFDESPYLERWSADTLPYAAAELGFGPDLEDSIVIWQSRPTRFAPRHGANRTIVTIHALARAEVIPS